MKAKHSTNPAVLCNFKNLQYFCTMPRVKAFDEASIIEKAKDLFQLKGYEGTSMQDLVDTLGISRSSLYDTFGDKHQLYLKTLNTYCDENAYALIKKADATEDPLAFIKNIFDIIIDQSKKDVEKRGCYVVNAIVEFSERNPDVTHIVNANNKAFEKMLEKLIEKAQLKKQISASRNPKQTAKFLFNTIYGLRVSSKTKSTSKELRDIAAMALEILTKK
jgi:TetR/AcrR family transcriptional regulator, transcriptional repressor for nem operon